MSVKAESLADLYKRLGSSEQGLSGEEARRRLGQYGPNETVTVRHTGVIRQILAALAYSLVLFVIRMAGNPFKGRPSRSLTITTLLIVLIGLLLPFTPLANALGFTPLPATYFLFLIVATSTYLVLVQLAKGRLMRRLLGD